MFSKLLSVLDDKITVFGPTADKILFDILYHSGHLYEEVASEAKRLVEEEGYEIPLAVSAAKASIEVNPKPSTVVTGGYRTIEESGLYEIRAHKPSISRMACHQWPSDEMKYLKARKAIIELVDEMRRQGLENHQIRNRLMKKGAVKGVKFTRIRFYDEQFFAECVI